MKHCIAIHKVVEYICIFVLCQNDYIQIYFTRKIAFHHVV